LTVVYVYDMYSMLLLQPTDVNFWKWGLVVLWPSIGALLKFLVEVISLKDSTVKIGKNANVGLQKLNIT